MSSASIFSLRQTAPAQFLILGSASPTLIRKSAESLAGRIETIEMSGFAISELAVSALPGHWLCGGFPRSYLADNDEDSFAWRRSFVQTIAERDLPVFGISQPAHCGCVTA